MSGVELGPYLVDSYRAHEAAPLARPAQAPRIAVELAAVPLAATGIALLLPLADGDAIQALVTSTSLVLRAVWLEWVFGRFRPLPDAMMGPGSSAFRVASGVFFCVPYATAGLLAVLIARSLVSRKARPRGGPAPVWPSPRATQSIALASGLSPLALGVMLYWGRSALFTVLVPLCCLTIATVLGHALAVAGSLVARGARGLALAVLAQTIAMTPIVVIAAALADRHALGLGGRIVALAWAAQSILCAVALLVPRARAVRG